MYYSPSTRGFYVAPDDVIHVTDEEHAALLAGQLAGYSIAPAADGRPVLIAPPTPTPAEQLAIAQAARRAAYIAESDPLYFAWQRGESTQADWLAAVAAIRARYPYPESTPPDPDPQEAAA